MRYCGRSTAQISFPLGGIGTGSIGLGGNGRFLDVEIGNAPNKDSSGEFTHFAVKAERNGRVLDARVLQGDLQPPYVGHGGAALVHRLRVRAGSGVHGGDAALCRLRI